MVVTVDNTTAFTVVFKELLKKITNFSQEADSGDD